MTVVRLPAPTKGIYVDTLPAMIDKAAARDLVDYIADRPGMLRVRGSLGNPVSYTITSTPLAVWVHGEKFLVTSKPDSVFYDTGVGTLTNGVATATDDLVLSGRSDRVGSFAYGKSQQASSNLLRWDGTAAAPFKLTKAPFGAAAVCNHLARLFVAGGSQPGTTTPSSPSTLWYTDPGGSPTDVLAEWQDDVSGLVNQIVVGEDGDPIVGLASLNGQLVIFKQHSIWALFGSSSASFSVRRVAASVGLGTALTIVPYDDSVFFVDTAGLPRLYDGGMLDHIEGVDSFSLARAVRLPGDYIYVSCGITSGNLGDPLLLHVPSRTWTKMAVNGQNLGISTGTTNPVVSTAAGNPYVFGSSMTRYLGKIGVPNMGSDLGTEKDASGSTRVIKPTVTTRTENLGVPFAKAVIRRIGLDYQLTAATGGSATAATFDMALMDRNLNVIQTIQFAADPDTKVFQRQLLDLQLEVDDLTIKTTVNAVSGTDFFRTVLLGDIWVEYDQAQRR